MYARECIVDAMHTECYLPWSALEVILKGKVRLLLPLFVIGSLFMGSNIQAQETAPSTAPNPEGTATTAPSPAAGTAPTPGTVAAPTTGTAPTPGTVPGTAPSSRPVPVTAPQPRPKPADPDLETRAKAEKEWLNSLNARPRLVSLQQSTSDAEDDVAAKLKNRLVLLGKKIFSNREWFDYWSKQKALANTLSKLYDTHAKRLEEYDPRASKDMVNRAQGLANWSTLAGEKVKNQDVYLQAIRTENDAVEERLEAVLETNSTERVLAAKSTFDLSPFQARRQSLAELKVRIAQQTDKLRIAEVELKVTQSQLEAEKILHKALLRDVELAQMERSISTEQARSTDRNWRGTWTPIRDGASGKVRKLEAEESFGQDRQRSLKVEVELAKSQASYRSDKSTELQKRYDEDNSFQGWAEAAWATLYAWILGPGWRVVFALLIIWLGVKAAKRVVRSLERTMVKAVADEDPENQSAEEQRAETIAGVFGGILRIIVTAVAFLLALEQLGVNTGPILGSVAILGLAISFGSQNLVRDVVTGFFILIENQFAVGDFVEIGGRSGTVEKINLRSTWIREASGTIHIIPNGSVSAVANQTRDWARAICHIGVGYGDDLNKVEEVVNKTGQEVFAEAEWKEIFLEAPYFVGVTELGDSCVTVRCMAKTHPGEQWGATRELNRRLKVAFDEAGIEIPFPQQVIWTQKAS
jgi:small conductance mechanosensitive channel